MDAETALALIGGVYLILAAVLLIVTVIVATRGRKDLAILFGSMTALWFSLIVHPIVVPIVGFILLILAIIFLIQGNVMVGWMILAGLVIGVIALFAISMTAIAIVPESDLFGWIIKI